MLFADKMVRTSFSCFLLHKRSKLLKLCFRCSFSCFLALKRSKTHFHAFCCENCKNLIFMLFGAQTVKITQILLLSSFSCFEMVKIRFSCFLVLKQSKLLKLCFRSSFSCFLVLKWSKSRFHAFLYSNGQNYSK